MGPGEFSIFPKKRPVASAICDLSGIFSFLSRGAVAKRCGCMSLSGGGMRPILALAILLLGLKAAVPEVKFGTMAELQFQEAKFQDRVPAAEEAPLSPDVESTGSIGESGISESDISALGIVQPDIGEPETAASEIKKSDRGLALLTPSSIEASETAHDQGEATAEPQSPAPVTTESDADASVADSIDGLCNALMTSAQDNDLPVPFFANLIWQESRLQRDSVSRAGALGIAQFMPEVANEVGLADPFDPRQAIPASARFLRVLRQHFGNLGYVAAAYNAGSHRVGDWLDRRHPLPQETRTYVLRVTGRSAEAWRKSAPDDSKLAFAQSLPCRGLQAFAELEQAQLRDAQLDDDAKDAQPQQEKIATRVAHLIVRKVAARAAAKAAVRVAAKVAAKVAVKVAAKAAPPVTPAGSVVHPLVADGKGTAKAARPATVNVMARNVNNRRDALRRPQPVPHEKRRVA
jgi:soluble lytic murein transglycosylase-like protein